MSSSDIKTCWVCYNSDMDEPNLSWIKPCRCKGTTKWVHQHCLQRWVDEKQRGDSNAKVNCRVCNTQYNIRYPSPGLLLSILETADNYIYKICPFFAGGLVITSLYWSGVTYGAVSIMQIMGHAEAVQLMEQMDPLVLLVGLPAVPIMLVLLKLIRWDEFLLGLWQRYSFRVPYLKKLFGADDIPEWRHQYNMQFPLPTNNNIPRLIVDALLMPSISTVFGRLLFSHIQPKWQQSALGSLIFILGKGLLNIFYQQKKYLRNCRREILDFDEDRATRSSPPLPSHSPSTE